MLQTLDQPRNLRLRLYRGTERSTKSGSGPRTLCQCVSVPSCLFPQGISLAQASIHSLPHISISVAALGVGWQSLVAFCGSRPHLSAPHRQTVGITEGPEWASRAPPDIDSCCTIGGAEGQPVRVIRENGPLEPELRTAPQLGFIGCWSVAF